ncbi:MAG: CHAT domain-containing tetratricopeptide repeat protein [Acidobacteriota bacterium]
MVPQQKAPSASLYLPGKIFSLRYKAFRGLTLCLFLVSLTTQNLAAFSRNKPQSIQSGAQYAQKLQFGEAIERDITGGEVHHYKFSLENGQYLRLAVEQRGVDVVTSLLGADGEPLIVTDSAGKETLSVIASETTVYHVVVRARQRNAGDGRYVIRIEERHHATPLDEIRINAEKLMAEGMQLSQRPDKENLRQAGDNYQTALSLWRKLEDRREEARALYLIALVRQDSGETQAALESYQQSLELSRAEGDREREHLALSALGTLYFALGDKRKAIDCYSQSLSFSQAQSNRTLETSLLVNLGVAYKSLGDHARALDFYQRALPSARAMGDQEMEAAVLTNLARLYDLTGDKQNSFVTNQQVLSLWRALGNLNGEVTTLKNLGTLAEAEERLPESLKYLNQALKLSQTLGDSMREAHIRGDLARVERAAGSFDNSRAQIEQALTILESTRGQLLNSDLRASFTAANRRYYEFYVDLLMRQQQLRSSNEEAGRLIPNRFPDYAAEALRVSESARARALSDLIAEAQLDIQQGVDAEMLSRERRLTLTLTAKKAEHTALVRKKAPAAEIALLEREILALGVACDQAKTEIKRASPQYASLVYPEPIGLPEIQRQLLDCDTLLLEYALGEERSYLWVASHDDLHSFTLPGRAEIEAQARRYYELLTARCETVKFEKPGQKQVRIAQAESELSGVASALSQLLLGAAADLLEQKRLLIVGDGMLNYIPFGALPEPAPERKGEKERGGEIFARPIAPSLVVSHEIVNLPSASVLASMRRDVPSRRQATSGLAVIADPVFSQNDARLLLGNNTSTSQSASDRIAAFLPSNNAVTESLAGMLRTGSERDAQGMSRLLASRQEAEGIARLAPGGRRLVALDFNASRDLVTSGALSQYRYLHFATHGLLNSQTPELSGLVFSLVDEKGRLQKGVLRLNDIYNLRLAADLVVLSACRTGLGKEVRGEGAIGLPRGFMYAGVRRVISSLWAVDDAATAELMTHFYREMLAGQKTPAAALRAAQLALLKEKKWQEPYFWAGFVLQGEPK